jgi:hypothetical protein
MEVKFNSLFNNNFDKDSSEYYPITKTDDTLLLNNLLLTFDRQSAKENVAIFERNFGDSKNYRIGPRPCSTRHASSNKFCENPGLPEIYEEKVDNCKNYFTPNSPIGERNQYLKNIDIEARLLKFAEKDSKCNTKEYKEDMCDTNDKNCALKCQKKIFDKNNIDPNNNRKVGSTVVLENNRKYCENRQNNQVNLMKNFSTFQPTKRRDVLNW